MARVTLSSLVETTMVRSGVSQVLVLAGATVRPRLHGTSTDVTIYAAETGATTITNPQTTSASGDVSGWVGSGVTYDIVVTHPTGSPSKTITVPGLAVTDFDRSNGQAGMLAPSTVGWNTAGLAPAANAAYFSRVVPSRDLTVVTLAIAVSTAASVDDACDVGIYSSALARLISAGATTGKLNATGVKTFAITPTALSAGTVYYVAFSCGAIGGTGATIRGANMADTLFPQLFGSTAGLAETFSKGATHPLPTTVSSPAVAASGPAMALRET